MTQREMRDVNVIAHLSVYHVQGARRTLLATFPYWAVQKMLCSENLCWPVEDAFEIQDEPTRVRVESARVHFASLFGEDGNSWDHGSISYVHELRDDPDDPDEVCT